ncbi:MAG: protein-methionine-sulfoxide reductase heme-binding subunit MsrQ [Pseudomonadota bacterium]
MPNSSRAGPSLTEHVNTAMRRISPWAFYIIAAVYGSALFFAAATGHLGVEPIEELEHRYGMIALQSVVLGLTVTPLRKHFGINMLKHRRTFGVIAFFFLIAHVSVWAILDVQSLSRVWADIVDRPYITIGMAGFLLMLPLGLTSNNYAIKRLGTALWCKIHKLVYPAAILGALHYVWLAKGFQIEPLVYLGLVLFLLALRLPILAPARKTRRA